MENNDQSSQHSGQQLNNQPSSDFQSQSATNIGQEVVSQPQATQSNFQQPPDAPVATVVTTQASAGGEVSDFKDSKLKYVGYFLLGLFLSVLGLLIGIILIFAKEKQNRMRKLIPLLLGLVASIIVAFILVGGVSFEGTTTTSTINPSQPRTAEEQELVSDLTKLYPNLTFQVAYGEHKPPLTIGNTTISTFVKVEVSSDTTITPEMVSETGKQVCTTLTRLHKSVSQVEVATVNKKSAVSQSLSGIGGTCDEYNSGEMLNTLQSM